MIRMSVWIPDRSDDMDHEKQQIVSVFRRAGDRAFFVWKISNLMRRSYSGLEAGGLYTNGLT
jgi:hypothetical protein